MERDSELGTDRVYHMVPGRLLGHTLYPLNILRKVYPEAHALQVRKYSGRENLMDRRIPLLACLWNDVLHFSTVHPAQIRDAMLEVGLPWSTCSWFEVSPRAAGFSRMNTVVWTYPPENGKHFPIRACDVSWFQGRELALLSKLRSEVKTYFAEMRKANRRPLLFHMVPHVLHHGAVETTELPIINV